ncbi:selenium cofactor biosynthesis protein YqeC [Lacrimispora sp.]|uniref:selenium cofactor biosynthesis protein YqeC n=1 Tax=Lacrimispora sp. TaxID=2719234 RepID=UPI0029E2C9CF|nr:hypothetical protein [Lacrimispora sp.]
MELKSVYAFEESDGKIKLKKKNSLWEALRLSIKEPEIIAFTGGGGKTTAMFSLAEELAGCGKRVIVTTSTHIYRPVDRIVAEAADYKTVSDFLTINKEHFSTPAGWILVTGQPAGEGKLKGMELAELEKLVQLCDVLLVEADGAKCHPIKIPRTGEPVLPKKTYAVIGCAGLTCIGEPWEEACFRYELAPCIFGCLTMEDRISPDAISQILTSINGTRKGAESMEYRILFNQADSDVRLLYAQAAAETMGKQWAQYCAVTSFHTNDNANTGTGKGQTR